MFRPFPFLLFFPSPLEFSKWVRGAPEAAHSAQRQNDSGCKSWSGPNPTRYKRSPELEGTRPAGPVGWLRLRGCRALVAAAACRDVTRRLFPPRPRPPRRRRRHCRYVLTVSRQLLVVEPPLRTALVGDDVADFCDDVVKTRVPNDDESTTTFGAKFLRHFLR